MSNATTNTNTQTEGLKYCNTCFSDLSTDNFTVNKCRSDGLETFCKDCKKQKSLETTENVRMERQKQTLVCSVCEKEQPGAEFKNSGHMCRTCVNKKKRAQAKAREAAKKGENPQKGRGYHFNTAEEYMRDQTQKNFQKPESKRWLVTPERKWFPDNDAGEVEFKTAFNFQAQKRRETLRARDGYSAKTKKTNSGDGDEAGSAVEEEEEEKEYPTIGDKNMQCCNTCQVTKKLNGNFLNDGRDGFDKQCVECTVNFFRTVPPGHKRCSVCDQVKSENDFNMRGDVESGRRGVCKKCQHLGMKESMDQYEKRYLEKHGEIRSKERVMSNAGRWRRLCKKGTSLTQEEFDVICNSPCVYCGRFFETKGYGVDRLFCDVGYIVDNCVSCCSDCNVAKKQLTPKKFIQLMINIHYKHGGGGCNLSPVHYPFESTPVSWSHLNSLGRRVDSGKDIDSKERYIERLADGEVLIPREDDTFFSREHFEKLRFFECYYCGWNLGETGLDRVDNTNRLYSISNVVPACSCCNTAKYGLTQDEFFELASRIVSLWGAFVSSDTLADMLRGSMSDDQFKQAAATLPTRKAKIKKVVVIEDNVSAEDDNSSDGAEERRLRRNARQNELCRQRTGTTRAVRTRISNLTEEEKKARKMKLQRARRDSQKDPENLRAPRTDVSNLTEEEKKERKIELQRARRKRQAEEMDDDNTCKKTKT